MQLGAECDHIDHLPVELQLPADPQGVVGHAHRMAARVGILLLEEMHQGLEALERELFDAVRLLLDALLELVVVHPVLENETALVERLHHARSHLVQVERLGDVVEGAELEAGDRALDLGDRRHDDDGGVRPAGEDLAQQRDAVHLRHPQVGDDERHGLRVHLLERLGAGARLRTGEPFPFEQAHQHASQARLIVHHEAFHGIRLRHPCLT